MLEIATGWTVGDKATGGVDPIVVFSNCESIKVYIGDALRGEFAPSSDEYGGLPHPLFVVRGLGFLWGEYWQGLTVEGYISEKCVIKKMMASDSQPKRLDVRLDSNELIADGQDMTWLKFRIVDKYDNPLPYISEIVTVTTNGPVSVIGTNPFITQEGPAGQRVSPT